MEGPASEAPGSTERPRGLSAETARHAHERLLETLRALIRIPTVNPPDPERPAAETEAAAWIAGLLTDAGLVPELIEPAAGRGSVVARLRGDGSAGPPLLLLSHLDVVPAGSGAWTHDPFGADMADGYVWGRGAVDMKNLVAMQIEVLRLLADEALAAGRDPASDPVPGLGRDVLFACTADEEAGGALGAGWLADHRPELLQAAGAINESGAIATYVADRRIYPIQVAEKGYAVYAVRVHGAWGHGSMPRPDNAIVRAAEVVRRLGRPGPLRVTTTMQRFLDDLCAALPPAVARTVRRLAADASLVPEAATATATAAVCDLSQARALAALLRDTVSPDVLQAGVRHNVVPGEARIELDCRVLPGTSEAALRAELLERLGDLASICDLELLGFGPPVEASPESDLYAVLDAVVRDHDPAGLPLPVMAPFATDAKHLARLGVPCYGFSPLRTEPGERFLERFHGVDERVGIEALRWGLPVLHDAVRRFCASRAED